MSFHESDNTDEIIESLRQANPVAPPQAPSAQSEAAQGLLAQIISRPSGSGFGPYVGAERVEYKTKSLSTGRYRYLAAVAVALAVVAAGVSFMIPKNSEPALAALQTAAAQTKQADSGEMLVSMEVSGSDSDSGESIDINAEVAFAFNSAGDLSLSVLTAPQFDEQMQQELPGEFRVVDGVAYIQDGDTWMGFEAGKILEEVLGDYANPTKLLDEVQTLTEAKTMGGAIINDTQTTQYRAEINLADGQAFNARGWLGDLANGLAVDANGVVIIDFFVGDDDGLIHQVDVRGDLAEAGTVGVGGEAQIFVSTKFTNLNGDVMIEAPEEAEVMNFAEAFDN